MWVFGKKGSNKLFKKLRLAHRYTEHAFENNRQVALYVLGRAIDRVFVQECHSPIQLSRLVSNCVEQFELSDEVAGFFRTGEARAYDASGQNVDKTLWITTLDGPKVFLLIGPDAANDVIHDAPCNLGLHMYFKNHRSRDIFCFSEGHELLLSDSKTIETGFYSQNRSKIILQDGERRCVVGVQFATCASVPVYSSVMHNHVFSICPNNVLHRSSEVEFESLCASCGVNVFGKTTRSRALLSYLVKVEYQILASVFDAGKASSSCMNLLRLLLCASWHVTSHTLRLRYGEALMQKTDAFDPNQNTPDEIKILNDPHQQMKDHRERVRIVERCMNEDSSETRLRRRTSKQVFVNLETTHITSAAEEIDDFMNIEKKQLDELVKHCDDFAGHTKWKIIELVGNKVKIRKTGSKKSGAYETCYDEKVLCELYELVKNLQSLTCTVAG
jgi:hypothetical protein